MDLKIMPPEEVVPILLDRARSPVVSLDTEFDSSYPVCRSPLHGLSMAGGTPETGIVGCFWPFEKGYERAPWGWLRDRVLIPIFTDPDRTVVLHPAKVDLQTLHPRGIPDAIIRARIECTMSMAHTYDENLPKGLKELGECLLGVHGLQSYSATQKEMARLKKEGERTVKSFLKAVWEMYRDQRKKSDAVEARIDPAAPSWQRLALGQPPGLTRGVLESRVEPIIRRVITSDYDSRIRAVFEHYAALDALLTLGVRYFFVREMAAARVPFHNPEVARRLPACLELETTICHPLVTEMEEAGLKINIPVLRDIKTAMDAALATLREEVIRRWGFAPEVQAELGTPGDDDDEGGFNPGSTDQIAHIVWNIWKLRPPPWAMSHGEVNPKWRRKDGMCKVDQNVLDWLAASEGPHAEDIDKLMEWRRFAKLMSGFINPLDERASSDPQSRLHPSTWPVGARTGRFSQSEPNCENIPRPHTMPVLPIPPGADPTKPPPGVKAEINKKDNTVKAWRVGSLRAVFITDPGWSLVSLDLAQIENRLVAHESEDEVMYDLFTLWDCAECKGSGRTTEPLHKCPKCGAPDGKRDKSKPDQPPIKGFCLGKDIHAATAVALPGFIEQYGFEDGRQRAKAVNHASSYGMGARTFSRREGYALKEGDKLLRAWHARYPKIRGDLDHPLEGSLHYRIAEEVRNNGYVTMWDGHVRRFFAARVLLRSNNFLSWEWEGIIREAVNVLAQGGTAAGMKRAMVRTRDRLRNHENPLVRRTRLINQVHDEVVYETPSEVAKEVYSIAAWELEHAFNLRVPVIAEGGSGPNWEKAHA